MTRSEIHFHVYFLGEMLSFPLSFFLSFSIFFIFLNIPVLLCKL